MADRFTYSPAPARRVKALQFGILDPDYIVSLGGVSSRHTHAGRGCRGRWGGWPGQGSTRRVIETFLRPPRPPSPQRRYSVAKIETSQTYEKGRPKLGGLSDPRMGTMDRAVKCTTDGNSVTSL